MPCYLYPHTQSLFYQWTFLVTFIKVRKKETLFFRKSFFNGSFDEV
jgi:hypothetical protein